MTPTLSLPISSVFLPDTEATQALGLALSQRIRHGVVYLEGDLGAGKTTLVRSWLRALGVTGAIRSPTYTLIEPYEEVQVLHLDLYRLNQPEELWQWGLDSYDPHQGWLWLVEWPSKGLGALPAATMVVSLSNEGEGRRALVKMPP
jgi:tRNA threonylcarbamoyladenosine biosynthesis protein TsaE